MLVELPDGVKDWIRSYHNAFGYGMKNPRQRAKENSCWTNFRMFHNDSYWRWVGGGKRGRERRKSGVLCLDGVKTLGV